MTGPHGHAADRVAVISFTEKPSDRLKKHVHFLLCRGIQVTLVTTNAQSWEEFRAVPHLNLTLIVQYEHRHPLNRAESMLVAVAPDKIMSFAERAARTRVGRPLLIPVQSGRRVQQKVSRAAHHRIYNKLYQIVRPQIVAKIARRRVPGLRDARFDRIIAGDTVAFTLGWQLARLSPRAIATTSVDEEPYADLPVIVDIPDPVLRADDESGSPVS